MKEYPTYIGINITDFDEFYTGILKYHFEDMAKIFIWFMLCALDLKDTKCFQNNQRRF